MLWQDEPLRSGLASGDLVSLFSDEAAAGIVAALLSGESPEELEFRWRELGEQTCPSRLARGNAVLAKGELSSEHVEKLIEDLRTNAARRRYEHLKQLLLYGEATREEIEEHHIWAKKLKGNAGL